MCGQVNLPMREILWADEGVEKRKPFIWGCNLLTDPVESS